MHEKQYFDKGENSYYSTFQFDVKFHSKNTAKIEVALKFWVAAPSHGDIKTNSEFLAILCINF